MIEVIVSEPSGLVIVGGMNMDTPFNGPFTIPTDDDLNDATGRPVLFKIIAGGHEVGQYAGLSSAQEKITNAKLRDWSQPGEVYIDQPDSAWNPADGSSVLFQIMHDEQNGYIVIYDFKNVTVDSIPQPTGTAFKYSQQIRLNWVDACANPRTKVVGTYNHKVEFTQPDAWQTQDQ